MKKKRLLVLLGGYYPSYGAPGIVFEKMIPMLRDNYEIVILTPRRIKHDLGKTFEYNDVIVHEITDWINDRVVLNANNRWFRLIWRCVQNVWLWIQKQPRFTYSIHNTLKSAERLHCEHMFHAVISVSFPPYTHIVAAIFKHRHPNVKWVAYSTDTFFEHQCLSSWFGRIQMCGVLHKELWAYRCADAVLMTPEIYALRNRMFPDGEVKPLLQNYILSLPEQNNDINDIPSECREREDIHFVYTGVFYESVRNPYWFVKVMRHLLGNHRNFIFDFFLVTDTCKDIIESIAKDFPRNVVIHPAVLPSEVGSRMKRADFLLNFSNDADQFSPSKIFDYIAIGRPILNIAYPGRKVSDVLIKNPLSFTLVNDSDIQESTKAVEVFVERNIGKLLKCDELRSLYVEYLPENALKELVNHL